ncbi:MAG: hypothetical protein NVS3B14_07140 [Ktedonobacteraceae bacterium]
MQTSSREIILDQLQQAYLPGRVELSLLSANNNSTTGPAHNPFALLETIVSELMPAASLEHIVQSLAEVTRRALEMELCLVMLAGTVHGQLTIHAAAPDFNGRLLAIPPLAVASDLLEKLNATSCHLPDLDAHEREQLNPLKNVQYEKLHIGLLTAGKACLGLLCCYSSKARDLDIHEQLILRTIGSFAAVSIANRQLIDAAASTISVKSFFDDLLAGNAALEDSLQGRAAALGCDCAQPHVMLALEIARMLNDEDSEPTESRTDRQEVCRHAIKLVEQRMQARYPGSLFDERENHLHAIITLNGNVSSGNFKTWLDALVQQVESEFQVSLFAGISNACHALRDYYGGFAEAEEALDIAECLNARATSMQFDELGAYRYIYAFARDYALHDLYLEQVDSIARYDQGHKRAELLCTLEVYLAHRGNIKEAAEILDVHRNTLTQRLERIQSLCAVNLEHHSNWLPLQIAIMVHRLRAQLFTRW